MNEQIGDLLVKLGGDASQYQSVLDAAITNTESSLKTIQEATKAVEAAQGAALREAARLTKLVATPTEEYTRALEHERRVLPQVTAAKELATAVEAAYNEQMRSAAMIIESVRRPSEQYAIKLRELNSLLAAGAITQDVFNRAVRKLNLDFDVFHKTLGRIGTAVTTLGQQFTTLGMKMSFAITAPIALLAGGSVKEFAKLDDAMTQSLALVEHTADERHQLEERAIEISKHSRTASDEVAKGYYYLASAGMDVNQMYQSIVPAEKFAVAGHFELAKATEMLVDSQKALGLSSEDAAKNQRELTHVSDVLVKAGTSANATVEQFAEALTNKAATQARNLGKDIEEVSAVLAVFSNRGVKGAEAGEQVYIAMRDLGRAMEKEPKAWQEMNMSVYDAHGNLKNMADVIGMLEHRFKGASNEQQAWGFKMLGFEDRSLAALKTLMGSSEEIRKYEALLKSAGGVTERIAKEQMTSFTAQLQMLWNNVKAAGDEIGKTLAPMIRFLTGEVRNLLTWWNHLTQGTREVIVYYTILAATIGPLIWVIGKLLTPIGMLITGFNGLTIALGAVNSMLAIATGLSAGFIGAITAVVVAMSAMVAIVIGQELIQGWENAAGGAKKFSEKVTGFIHNLGANMKILFVWLKDNWSGVLFDMANVAATAFGNISHNIGASFAHTFKNIGAVAASAISLNQYGGGLGKLLRENEIAYYRGTNALLQGFKSSTTQLPQFIYEKAEEAGKGLVGGAAAGVSGGKQGLKAAVDGVEEILVGPAKGMHDLMKKLNDDINTFGMKEFDKEIYKLKQEYKGLTDADFAQAHALSDKLHVMEDEKKATEKAQKLAEKWMSPAEKYIQIQDELKDMLDKGTLSQEAFNHELHEAHKELDKSFKMRFEVHGLDALLKGSAEAMELIERTRKESQAGVQVNAAVDNTRGRIAGEGLIKKGLGYLTFGNLSKALRFGTDMFDTNVLGAGALMSPWGAGENIDNKTQGELHDAFKDAPFGMSARDHAMHGKTFDSNHPFGKADKAPVSNDAQDKVEKLLEKIAINTQKEAGPKTMKIEAAELGAN